MSDSRRNVVTLLRAEFAEEAATGFTRLRRIPQTDIIWFLDYFSGLTAAERETLLDTLADSGAMAFFPRSTEIPTAAPALAQMCEARGRPGAKGGTRYTDLKMLSANRSMQEPGGYHSSWRENLTALHFQPRPDLLPDLSQLKPAKAPLVRKLVNAALSKTLGFTKVKLAGGPIKYIGRFGDCEVKVWVDFGSMLSQLGYSVSLKGAGDQPLAVLISYERLWGTDGRWDYLTEENAPRSIAFFAEQLAYLADLAQRLEGQSSRVT